MNANELMAMVLRSPLHGMLSGNAMLITLIGRKSGCEICLPVNYVCIRNELWVVSSRDRTWWKNLIDETPVRLWLKRKEVPARAEAVLDAAQIAEMLPEYLRQTPMSARSMNVRKTDAGWDEGDLARAAQDRVMVQVALAG